MTVVQFSAARHMDDTQKTCTVSNVQNNITAQTLTISMAIDNVALSAASLMGSSYRTPNQLMSRSDSLTCRFHRYLARILPRRLRSFCKHPSPHPIIIVHCRDKKKHDRWWYASRLFFSSFLSSLHENNTFEYIFYMGFFSLKPLAFFLRRLAVCIVKLFVLVERELKGG